MRKNVLMLAPRGDESALRIERSLLSLGFDTLRVTSVRDAVYRIGSEIFSSLVCIDAPDGSTQRELSALLVGQPLGAVTPVVVLGEDPEPKERAALTSILDQYFPLSTDPVIVAEFCGETHQLRTEKAKRGSLGPVSVPQILSQIARVRMSGAVVLEKGDEKAIIYLENGFCVFASSNRDENRFGEFLVRQGIIPQEAYVRASGLLRETGKRFGQILVEEGVIKPQVLTTLIQSQVKHIIYTVFDWMEGEFYVLPDEKSGQTEGVARFEVASLIVEGVRFRFTQEKLSRHFHPFDRSVSLAVPLQEIAREARLGKDEADFLALLATKRPIEELLRLQSFSPADSLKLLYAFQTLGWICLEKGSIPPPERDRPEKGRSQAVAELFRSHLSSSQPPTPPSEGERGEEGGKRNWRVHSLLGAAAISLFFWIITFVDPRALRVGTSDEISRPEVPPPSPTAVPSPQATEGGASVPSPSPPIKRRVWDEATGWMARAELLRKEGNLGEALAAARKAARLRPADLTIRLRIGDILFESGRNREARDLYEGVIRSDPTLADPYLSLATAWLIERENEKAEQALRKYLALVKRTPETQGRVMEAQKVLQSLKVRR